MNREQWILGLARHRDSQGFDIRMDGGGVGSEARAPAPHPARRPTPQPGSPSVYHTLAATQRGESNAGPVEIPMMALPKDSAIASLPAPGGHALVYLIPGQS